MHVIGSRGVFGVKNWASNTHTHTHTHSHTRTQALTRRKTKARGEREGEKKEKSSLALNGWWTLLQYWISMHITHTLTLSHTHKHILRTNPGRLTGFYTSSKTIFGAIFLSLSPLHQTNLKAIYQIFSFNINHSFPTKHVLQNKVASNNKFKATTF